MMYKCAIFWFKHYVELFVRICVKQKTTNNIL